MSSTDESENLLDHLTERINANGWRVISNPAWSLEPEADELKQLIQTVQGQQRVAGKRKYEETDPPEAA
jgi:uroporphyrinogen-III synthase